MGTVLLILILVGAALALVAGVRALRAYLSYRRARAELQEHLAQEVDRLALRTGELEKNLSALDSRVQQLPLQISELQQSLSTLRILTGALAASLRQVQRILSYSSLKDLGSERIASALRSRRPREQKRRSEAPGDAAPTDASP
jgi:chromosome segregation ATPase